MFRHFFKKIIQQNGSKALGRKQQFSVAAVARQYGTKARVEIEPTVTEEPNASQEAEPSYDRSKTFSEETVVHYTKPFKCQYGGVLPELYLSYEAWGELNSDRSNVVLIQHGLSGSTHARSHLVRHYTNEWFTEVEIKDYPEDSSPGWWEKFIGPGMSLDTNKFFIICVNLLGSCYGTTGPSTINPVTNKPYGGDFPIISIGDMARSQFILLDLLGIKKVHALVGGSLGGLAAFWSAANESNRIDRKKELHKTLTSKIRVISISGGGSSAPSAIAYRYLQRVALMMDPKWNNGHYYDGELPMDGTKLARKIATLTYRSGPEWEKRFKNKKITHKDVTLPRYHCAEFEIEDYIRHQGASFLSRTRYDPNSLIYLSKAMDIFDIGEDYDGCQRQGFAQIKLPTLIMGATSDILYPPTKQIEAAQYIREGGNSDVVLKMTEGHYGHDTFLLDVDGMGKNMKEKGTSQDGDVKNQEFLEA